MAGFAKAGVVVADDLLFYETGGYGRRLDDSDERTVGAGVEVALAENITARARHLHGFALTDDNPKDRMCSTPTSSSGASAAPATIAAFGRREPHA